MSSVMPPDDDFTPSMPATTSSPNRRLLWLAGGGITLLLCGLVCGTALLISLLQTPSTIPITVVMGGEAYQRQTGAATVADLLAELNIVLSVGDALVPEAASTLTPGMVVRVERAREVTLTIGDREEVMLTLFTNPLDILNEAGITLEDADRVIVDGTEASAMDLLVWPVPATHITVQQAVSITLDDDGTLETVRTTQATVGEALFEAGITLYLADTVTPELNAAITDEMTIAIRRSQPISIVADGVTLETRTQGTTVRSALADAGVALMGLDYAIPSEDSPLQPGMSIRVIRVTEQVEAVQDTIVFETVYQADSTLELDQTRLLQEGQNGIQQTNVRVRYENGVEVAREVESTGVAVEPVNRVIAYGTNVVVRTVDTPDGPREYWRKLRLYATSYHPAALGGDNVTATGRILTKGIVGIDPTVIPYGTELYVPGYGVGIAADTGGPRSTRLWIDLGYDDENWVSWSRPVDVYLLTPVPAEIDYILPG
jgi:uncharacterized protein YabE (DUF348 family)